MPKNSNAWVTTSQPTTVVVNAVAVVAVAVVTDPKLLVNAVKEVNAVKVVIDLVVVVVIDPKPLSLPMLKVKVKVKSKERKAKPPTDLVVVATVIKANPVKALTPWTAKTVLAKLTAVIERVVTVRATGAKLIKQMLKKKPRKKIPDANPSPSPRRNPKSNTRKLVSLLMTTRPKSNPQLLVSSLRRKSVLRRN